MIPTDAIPRAATVARSTSRRLPWGPTLVRLAVPVAVWLASTALATFSHAGAVETAFLGRWAAGVLAVVALVSPAPARELGWGAVLATLILWVLPPDPTRSAALGLLLVAVLALASLRALGRRGEPEGWRWSITVLVLALGWYGIFASDALALGEISLGALVSGPVLAGAALADLGRHYGRSRALLAGAAILVACQGFDPPAGLSLTALSIWENWRRRGRRRTDPGNSPEPVAWATACAVAAGLGLTLALLTLLEPAAPTGTARPAGNLLVRLPLLGPLLLPAAFLAPLSMPAEPSREQRIPLTLGLALLTALGVAWYLQASVPVARSAGWLALPLTLIAFTVPVDRSSRGALSEARTALLQLQGGWSALLLAATAVPAAYPWLRGRDLDEPPAVEGVLGALGLDGSPGLWSVLGVVAVLGGLSWLARRDRRLPLWGAVAGLVLLVVLHLPPAPLAVATGGGRLLTHEAPSWQLELPGEVAGMIVLDTLLAHSASLATGTPVATVTLEETGGRSTEWQLAAGLDTGEWAAARTDVATQPGARAPRAWVSWLERDGSNGIPGEHEELTFLARRYRTRIALDSPHPGDRLRPRRLTVTRRSDLPPEVQLTLFHAEVRP